MKSATDLLRTLRDTGIELRTDGERLQVQGPAAVLTEPLYQQLLYWKPELIDLLWGNPSLGQPAPPEVESAQPVPATSTVQEGIVAEARFRDGSRVQVRAESPGHFAVWLLAGGRWQRRNGFSTPYAEHARRTAEQWYGPPRAGGPSGTEARQSISTLTDRIHSRSQGGS